MTEQPKPKIGVKGKAGAGALVLLVGATAANILPGFIEKWEGMKYIGYLDVVGVPTVCAGDTQNVVVGKRYSEEECRVRLERQIIAHAKPVLRCTPDLHGHPYQIIAATSLAYNIGGSAYCRSTVARRFNAGNWNGACDALMMWNKAGGRVWRGLVNRRTDEKRLCYAELPADKVVF